MKEVRNCLQQKIWKYHTTAERILNALDNSPVPISWHEMDRCALQSVIAKELILIDKEAR